MSFVERKIILNYLKNLDETNLQKNGSKIFQDGAILNKTIKKDEFIKYQNNNIRELGLEYNELDYSKALSFLLMLANSLNMSCLDADPQ